MYLVFVDYSKAFDMVNWKKLGVPDHLISLIQELYQHNYDLLRINDTTSNNFQARKGGAQGCILSTLLFNIFPEQIMRAILDNWQSGIFVGGRKINN